MQPSLNVKFHGGKNQAANVFHIMYWKCFTLETQDWIWSKIGNINQQGWEKVKTGTVYAMKRSA